MSRRFTEHHVRPGVFYYSPKAHNERHEVKLRREEAQAYYKQAKALDADTPEAAEQAEHLLSLAVAAWPQNAKFLLALANCICFKRKDPERALYWYDHLVDVSDSPAHRMARARALACLGWLDNALSDIQSAVAGEPENGMYLQLRGMVQERMGEFYEAAMDFTAALPLLKASGGVLSECIFNRGYCHRLMGNHEEALKDLEDAQHKAPASNAIKMTLASMYLAKKRYNDALPLFQAVAASQRSSAAAINNVALVYYLMATKEDDADPSAARRRSSALKVANKPATGKSQPQQQGSKSAHYSLEGHAPTQQQGSDLRDCSMMNEEQRRQARQEEDAAIMNEVLSDDDEEDNLEELKARSMAVGYKKGTANEDPRQWALSVVNSGASQFSSDPAHLGWLRTSLELFNKAMELYLDDAERTFACMPSNQDTHAIHEEEPADAWSGYLLILTNQVRVPGSAAIHDRELEDGELHYNRGLANLALGKLLEAEEDFAEALRSAPTHAHYPHYRAVVHGRKGEFKEAVKWNLSALALNSQYFPALYHLGLCLYLQGRNAESIAQLDLALAKQPRSSEVMEARGRVLQELDRHTEALMSLQDALRHLSPEESSERIVRLHFSMAQSAIITHASEMLRTSLNQAKLHGQDPASVYGLRGLLAHREGRLHHAHVCLSRAVFLAPEEARFRFDRSQLMLDLQDWEACLDDLHGSMELLPDCASLYYTCGMILYATGNMQQAQENFEKAVEIVLAQEQKRRGSTRLVSAALALQSSSHISQAAQHGVSRTGGTEPKARWTRPGQATSLGNLRKVTSSGEGAECILRPDPRLWEGTKFITGAASPPDLTASLWYHLGCARASTNSYEGAAAALEQAHAYLPGHPAIMHELAKAYLAMGCVDAAEPLLTGVLSIQPGNAWALFRRGLCCMASKDYDRAAADLSSAKAMLPDEPALAVDVKLIRAKWSEMVRQRMGPGPGGEAFVWDLALWPPALQKSLPQ